MAKETDFMFSVHWFKMDTELQKKGNKSIDKNKFREQVKAKNNDLQEKAKGVYIFALNHGDNYIPYYVGQTTKSRLLQESTNDSNLRKYDKCLGEHPNRKPIMIYIVYRTKKNAVSKKQHPKAEGLYKWLETYLINLALRCNSELINKQKTSFPRVVVIPDLLNSKRGTSTKESKILKKVFDVK